MIKTTYDRASKVWSGSKISSNYNVNASLGQVILSALGNNPQQITQISVENDAAISCHVMQERMFTIAKILTQIGFAKGDIVGVNGTNSEYLAPVVFACFTLGLPVNFLPASFQKSDIIHMYGKTRPKLIFCDGDIFDVVNESVQELNYQVLIITLVDKVDGVEFLEDMMVSMKNVEEFL